MGVKCWIRNTFTHNQAFTKHMQVQRLPQSTRRAHPDQPVNPSFLVWNLDAVFTTAIRRTIFCQRVVLVFILLQRSESMILFLLSPPTHKPFIKGNIYLDIWGQHQFFWRALVEKHRERLISALLWRFKDGEFCIFISLVCRSVLHTA